MCARFYSRARAWGTSARGIVFAGVCRSGREMDGTRSTRTCGMDSGGRIAGAAGIAAAQIRLGSGDEGSLSGRNGGEAESGCAVERGDGFLRDGRDGKPDAPAGAVARELRRADRGAPAAGVW